MNRRPGYPYQDPLPAGHWLTRLDQICQWDSPALPGGKRRARPEWNQGREGARRVVGIGDSAIDLVVLPLAEVVDNPYANLLKEEM